MFETINPERAFSVIVNGPALTEIFELQAPTGTLFVFVPNLNLNDPLTPVPLAWSQICSKPFATGVGVGGLGVRVAVGVPIMLFL